jgi:glutamate-1-semialdehyde 2,1-aminomutase
VKFSGCYHGHVDALLVKAGSGVVTLGLADSAGVTATTAQDTIVLPLNDEGALRACFEKYGHDIAAVILEPLPANNGLLVQTPAWLKTLRTLTQNAGSLLIFDEVITGFRFGYHGYGKLVDVTPDLTTLGKIVGGGLPVGAVVGPKAILEKLAPLGPVYQAGTMAGNPVALAAGIATLDELKTGPTYATVAALGKRLDERATEKKLPLARIGSVFWIYLDDSAPIPNTAEGITEKAVQQYRGRYRGWLKDGVYLPPSAYEVGFLSGAHEPAHIDMLIDVVTRGATTPARS